MAQRSCPVPYAQIGVGTPRNGRNSGLIFPAKALSTVPPPPRRKSKEPGLNRSHVLLFPVKRGRVGLYSRKEREGEGDMSRAEPGPSES